jgi:nickel-dependent lactate racemase
VRGVHRATLARGACGPGIIDGNPFRAEVIRAAQLADIDWSVQCVAASGGGMAHVAAGELEPAVGGALEAASRDACLDVDRADVVITSAGGRPLDRTLYQAVKGWVASLAAVRTGGDVLLCAELSDGVGSEEFETQLRTVRTREEFERVLAGGTAVPRDAWMLQHVFQARARARLHVVSSLPRERLAALGFEAWNDASEAVAALTNGGRTVLVLPDGPSAVVRAAGELLTLEGAPVPARGGDR